MQPPSNDHSHFTSLTQQPAPTAAPKRSHISTTVHLRTTTPPYCLVARSSPSGCNSSAGKYAHALPFSSHTPQCPSFATPAVCSDQGFRGPRSSKSKQTVPRLQQPLHVHTSRPGRWGALVCGQGSGKRPPDPECRVTTDRQKSYFFWRLMPVWRWQVWGQRG